MGKRRREQLNADAQKLQVQRLGELVDQKDALLLSDLPAQYQGLRPAAADREQTKKVSRRFRWLRAL